MCEGSSGSSSSVEAGLTDPPARMDFDSSLLHHVIQLRRPWLDDVMLLASALGAGGFIWGVTALIAMVFPALAGRRVAPAAGRSASP